MAELLTREELGHLYSPSRWSKRLPADVVVVQHDKIMTEGKQLCALFAFEIITTTTPTIPYYTINPGLILLDA